VRKNRWYWDYMELAGFLALFGIGLLLLVALVMTSAYYGDRASCNGYQNQTGRETRFVNYWLLSWDCVVRSSDGRWVPVDQVREVPR
jgi:hypothetical protein